MSATDAKSLALKIFPWIMDLAAAGLLAWAAQLNQQITVMQNELQGLKEWKAETAGNRYTAKDHASYAESNAKELQQLWKEIAGLQQTWLRDMGEIKVTLAQLPTKSDLQVLDNRLRAHEERANAALSAVKP